MSGRIRRLYRKFKSWRTIVWEAKAEYDVPFFTKLRYALHGFSANEYIWFDFRHHDYREYISEYERMAAREINGRYKFILDNKLIFEEVFGKYVRVPVNYAWISHGHIYGLRQYHVNNENIIDFLYEVRKAVLKYLDSGGGAGTYIFEQNGGRLLVNGQAAEEEEILGLFGRAGESILCEYITQSGFASSLYPETTNTMRIVCAKRKDENTAKVVAAAQRIGNKKSAPVDNVSRGGFVSRIDLKSGELSEAFSVHKNSSDQTSTYVFHPDSGGMIKGRVIPGWERLKTEIEVLTNQVPYLNFVAWDVLLTEESEGPGSYCIIEGNASTDYTMFQMQHGMTDSELGRVLFSYKNLLESQ